MKIDVRMVDIGFITYDTETKKYNCTIVVRENGKPKYLKLEEA